MSAAVALAALAAPAALALVALVAVAQPGPRPRAVLLAGRVASAVSLAAALAAILLVARHGAIVAPLLGSPAAGPGVRLDALSVAMFALVAFLGAVVLRYGRHYLDGDARHGAFLGGLALTTAAVMLLVLAPNLWQLVGAWIATSVALHRLLLFYPERPRAVVAARKKFVVARLGDVCLLAAAVLLARAYGTAELGGLLDLARADAAAGSARPGVGAAALLVVAAAMLKAAQFPTHGWLVELMETPTPVSALLHAGILNGGVFLVARLAPVVLAVPAAGQALVVVGGLTALLASIVMVTQPSVKVALAYSSAAHMGFSLLLCGLGAYPMAILHLVAHSCYKAHAFLAAGSVVDAARAAAPAAPPPRPWHLAVGLLLATGIAGGAAAALGTWADAWFVTLALAAVLAFGLTQLFVAALRTGGAATVVGRAAIAGLGTVLAFFALELGTSRALADVLPVATDPAPLTVALGAAVVTAFGVATLLQLLLPARAASPAWARWHVHVRNGFYATAAFDRLVGLPRRPGPRLLPDTLA